MSSEPLTQCPPLVEVEIARKCFADPESHRPRIVLEDLGFALRAAEVVAVVGPSGCGKTTLLQLIAGLDRDFEGRVAWADTRSEQPPRLGYVFQNPRLLPWLTLRKNIELVLNERAHPRRQVDDLLALTGLSGFAELHANRLSVGMQRRAALARAFAVQPQLLLMDEPFVSLDAPTAQQLRRLLIQIWDRTRPTILFVTHDLREATMLADRILCLSSNPARLIAEIPVGIPRTERLNETATERRHTEIRSRFERLYA
ncbi:Taurine-transporting ATPase [Thiorhodococcus drewsii AZ1]|uniref:Taurine-transporting ATPase n=1 Tax=Thiorhodococcus drewsii AZ1 TaxID=765913 RepID=G2DX27_9GAMM|nr:ATP-binding cassette domain-containing protein [Thiorhodococcus drewsii]EGV33381.1 Taurine-transporting ATPase [Thiorhodococcus drewsii AZ1]